MNLNWKKWLLTGGGTGLIVLLALQATNPARTNPAIAPGADLMATNPPSPEVAALLHAACYDCHSYETTWPWYAHIAPASWLVVSDVNEGREHLNFSAWPHADPARAAKKLDRINEVLDYREMPPAKYTLIHVNARLTDAQRQSLLDWSDAAAKKLRPAETNQ